MSEQQPVTRPEPTRSSRRALLTTGAVAAVATGAAVVGRLTAPVTTTPAPAPPGERRFADQVVMITGATSGIGQAAAEAFAAEGADVWFCGRREHRGADVQQAIRATGGSGHVRPRRRAGRGAGEGLRRPHRRRHRAD